MRIAAQKVNNTGIQVSKKKLTDATKFYTITYNQMCERLFDLGYISSSVIFYEDEFWEAFFSENPDFIMKFRNNRTGAMNMSVIQIKYVLASVDKDSDVHSILSTVVSLLDAKQALEDFNRFTSVAKFPKKSDGLNCKTNLYVSNKVSNSGKLLLDSPYIMKCFVVPEGKSVLEFNYSIKLLEILAKKLGIEDNLDLDAESLFLGKGFTIKDDRDYLVPLINGEIEGTGKYAKLLHDTVEKYYVDYYNTRTTIAECIGYAEQNFLDSIPTCIDYINDFRSSLGEYKEFFVDSNSVYFLVDAVESNEDKPTNERFIGANLHDYFSGKPLSVINRLLGYCGQYIYEYDSNISNMDMLGVPVEMYQLSMLRGKIAPLPLYYYPIINVKKHYKEGSVELYPSDKVKSEGYKNLEDVLNFLEVDSIDSLVSDVANVITKTYGEHTDSFRKLVGILIQSLVCVMCDYTLDGHKAPNHIILESEFDWVTEENYLDACVEAEILFNKLGF